MATRAGIRNSGIDYLLLSCISTMPPLTDVGSTFFAAMLFAQQADLADACLALHVVPFAWVEAQQADLPLFSPACKVATIARPASVKLTINFFI
ncbi:MAG: hypothetical protein ACYDH9_02695 [Limisphaerales bacterium]